MISVIMAVFNGEKYLQEAIDSILNQTLNDFEFIIIDDCSNDQTPEIINMFANQDKRIKVTVNKEQMGSYASANVGLSFIKGKYIARMDADDISDPNRFEKQVQFLEANPQIGLLGSAIEIIDENGSVLRGSSPALDDHLIRWILLFDNSFTHSSWMVRVDSLNKVGGRYDNLPIVQDYALASKLSKISRVANLPDFLIKWRISDNQISVTRKEEQDSTATSISFNNINDLMGLDFINQEETKILRSILHSKGSLNKNNYSVYKNIFRIYDRFIKTNHLKKQEINDISKWIIRKSFSCTSKKTPFIIKLKIMCQCLIINPFISIYYFVYKLLKGIINKCNFESRERSK